MGHRRGRGFVHAAIVVSMALTLAATEALAQNAAPPKIAIIAFEQAVVATNEGQQAVAAVQKKYEPKKNQIDAQGAEVETLKKQLLALPATTPDEERATRLKMIDVKEKALQRDADDAQKAYQADLQEAYGKVAQKVGTTAVKYVHDHGFTVLLNVSGQQQANPVLWFRAESDVTQAVVYQYNAGAGTQAPVGSNLAQAFPAKVVVMDFESAVMATNEGQQAVAGVQKKYGPQKTAIDAQSAEVDSLKQRLKELPANASDEVRAALIRNLDLKEKALQHAAEDAQNAYQADLQDAYGKVATKVGAASVKYVQDHGFTLLINKALTPEAILWAAPGYDAAYFTAHSTNLGQAIVEAYNVSSGIRPPQPPPPAVAASKPAPVAPVVLGSKPVQRDGLSWTPVESAQPETAATASSPNHASVPVPAQAPPVLRAVTPEQTRRTQPIDNGKYYALVIGINSYPAPLPSLKTAENDAQAIARTLRAEYGFEVKLLLGRDATRNSILAAVNHYEDALQPNDNLLIYYAGHGYENKTTSKAYWLPADADSTYSPNRIIADDITSEMAAIPARHILVISDSCYSGGLTREAPTTPRATLQSDAFLKRMLSSRSRTLMASGGDEPVSDSGRDNHSVFAYALLQALNAKDEPMFSASDLFYDGYTGVRQRVAGSSGQLPQYAVIRNSSHEDGDFVFIRGGARAQ